MSAKTKGGGMDITTGPNVCLFQPPAPGPPVPQPIPTMADNKKAKKASKKVKGLGKGAVMKPCEVDGEKGHPPGMHNMKGVVSKQCMKNAEFTKGSGKVKVEGKAWVHQGVPTKHDSTNMAGMQGKPSQGKISVMP